jgi:RNA polymerase sigma factor for flagellar operon FliA
MDGNDRDESSRRDELIEEHLHFPRVIARQLAATSTRAAFLDDLIAAGNVGLVEAAERFDPACGVRFSTFAWPRIKGAMIDGLRTGAHYRRSDVAQYRAAAAKEETCRPSTSRQEGEGVDESWPNAEEAVDLHRCFPRIAEALSRLPSRERQVMQQHYFEGLQLSEIAARMGVHRSWCTRLHQQALSLLQRDLGPAETAEREVA